MNQIPACVGLVLCEDDPTEPTPIVLPVTGCTFENPGRYQVSVFVDKELIALAIFDMEVAEE
jgi:hypothetical protein